MTDNWRKFSLRLEGDCKIRWDTHRYAKGVAHRPFNLKAKVQHSLNLDFANFCPAIDDELPDDVIVFAVPGASENDDKT